MPYKKERIKTYITPQGDGNFLRKLALRFKYRIKTYITPQGDGNALFILFFPKQRTS